MTNPVIKTLMQFDDAYHNKKELISDTYYDILYQAAQKAWPNDPYFKTVGAPVKDRKIKLYASKGGLPQLRPDEAVAWMAKTKQPIIVMAKPDGISGQLVFKNGKLIQASTRGDGVEGQNILAHAKHVIGVWQTISAKYKDKVIVVDGEFTMHRSVFAQLNLDKYVNTRSLCNGMLLRDEPLPELLGKMVFVAYGWVEAGKYPAAKFEQLNILSNEMFMTVNNCGPVNVKDFNWLQANIKVRHIPRKFTQFKHFYHEKPVTKAWILSTLDFLRTDMDMDMDGLVFTINAPQKKAMVYSYKIKPDRVDQVKVRAEIKTIEWNLSSRSLYIPVAILTKPAMFNGTGVKRATLNNFAQVHEMQIGTGSIVELVKSGDVIPHVERVIKAKGFVAPKRCPACNAKFIFTGTHLKCDNDACTGAHLKLTINFFKKLNVDALGKGTLEKFAQAGYTSVAKVLSISPQTMSKLERMGEKSAANIINSLKKMMGKWRLHEFMAASGIFANENTSLGETILKTICDNYTMTDFRNGKIDYYQLTLLPQIGKERAELFVECLPDFFKFYNEINAVLNVKFVDVSKGILSGKSFAFTNFRSKELEEQIKKEGGSVGGVTKATTALFYADASSTKMTKAKQLISQGQKIDLVPSNKAAQYIAGAILPF